MSITTLSCFTPDRSKTKPEMQYAVTLVRPSTSRRLVEKWGHYHSRGRVKSGKGNYTA